MNINDLIRLGIYESRALIPYVLAILIVSIPTFIFLFKNSKNLWFNSKYFNFMGIFFSLRTSQAFKLACVWIKSCTVIFYLLFFTQLQTAHYIFLAVPCLLILLLDRNIMEIFNHLINTVVQFIGVISANIICSYIWQFGATFEFIVLYIFVAVIIVLYSVYIFISDINFISQGRRLNVEVEEEGLEDEEYSVE